MVELSAEPKSSLKRISARANTIYYCDDGSVYQTIDEDPLVFLSGETVEVAPSQTKMRHPNDLKWVKVTMLRSSRTEEPAAGPS